MGEVKTEKQEEEEAPAGIAEKAAEAPAREKAEQVKEEEAAAVPTPKAGAQGVDEHGKTEEDE